MVTEFRRLLFLFLIIFFIYPLFGAQVKEVRYYGYSGIVDLSTIEYPSSKEITEEWIKRVIAEITGIYHSMGYNAFYVEQVLIKDDGSVEFYFNESVVSSVVLSGAGDSEADAVKSEIFPEGSPYNEFLLKKNIESVKRRYGFRNIHVLLERDSSGKIVINAEAVKIIHRLRFSVTGDSIYGTMPEVAWFILQDNGFIKVLLNSSFGQRDTRVSNSGFFYNRIINRSDLLIGLKFRESRDCFSENELYKSRSISPEAAFSRYSGPFGAGVFFSGDYYMLENYNGLRQSEELSFFSGIRLFYDNSPYVIDRSEKKNFLLEISGGGNSLENNGDVRFKSSARFSFSLFSRCALILKNYFFMTTEDERLFSEYVFDNSLPGRMDDYSVSDFKNSAGIEAEFEIYPSLFYAGPVFYYGIYRSEENEYNDASSGGIGFSFELKGADVNGAYIYDTSGGVGDGSFLFSVSGTFQ
jgi:hypothetical protein